MLTGKISGETGHREIEPHVPLKQEGNYALKHKMKRGKGTAHITAVFHYR